MPTGERAVEAAEDGTGSTPRAVDEAIRRLGARPIASIDDLDRFRADLWDSDEELDSFLQWVRASRNGDA